MSCSATSDNVRAIVAVQVAHHNILGGHTAFVDDFLLRLAIIAGAVIHTDPKGHWSITMTKRDVV